MPEWSAPSARPRDASTAPMAKPPGRRSVTSTVPTAGACWRGSTVRARAGLVTPLRDGMNLVAKEYVAAQGSEDPGVLVLSRFAGAAAELTAALLVNPYDPETVATSITHALSMPLEERRARYDALYRVISANDGKAWSEHFLSTLTKKADAPIRRGLLGFRPAPSATVAQ